MFKKDETMADRTVLEQTVKATLIDYIAFIYLFAGYLVGILGNCTMDRFITLPIVGIITLVLIVIPFNYAKIKASKFSSITKDEIPNKEGVVIIEYDE